MTFPWAEPEPEPSYPGDYRDRRRTDLSCAQCGKSLSENQSTYLMGGWRYGYGERVCIYCALQAATDFSQALYEGGCLENHVSEACFCDSEDLRVDVSVQTIRHLLTMNGDQGRLV